MGVVFATSGYANAFGVCAVERVTIVTTDIDRSFKPTINSLVTHMNPLRTFLGLDLSSGSSSMYLIVCPSAVAHII